MEKRAVIVGVNRYQDDQITNLDWAVSDATLMKGVLDDCGFSRTRLLTSEMSSITVDNHTIEHSVRELREGLGPEDLLVFYFAGHGYQDAEWGHLLLPANVVYEDLKSDKSYRRVKAALRVSDLEELMGAQGAGRLILLDACRTSVESANRDLDSGMSEVTARDLELVVEKAADRHSASQERGPVGIICGCSKKQKSYELKDKGGVFTHGLIADLKATREAGEAYRFPTRFESIQNRMNQLIAMENRSWKQQPFCKVEGGVIELLAGKGEDLLAEELRKKEEEEKEKARQAAEAAALEEERQRREAAERLARAEEQEEAARLAEAEAKRQSAIQESKRKLKELEEAERRAKEKSEAERKRREAEVAKSREEERKRREEDEARARKKQQELRKEQWAKEKAARQVKAEAEKQREIEESKRKLKELEEAERRAKEKSEAERKRGEAEVAKSREEERKRREMSVSKVKQGTTVLVSLPLALILLLGLKNIFDVNKQVTKESELANKAPQIGSDFTIGGLGTEMVWIEPGTFMMGSPKYEEYRDDDEKQFRVTLTQGFWIGKYEMTQGQWVQMIGNNPSRFKDSGKRAPVETVSWEEVQEFIKKLNERENTAGRLPDGYEYSLPTEAQWEYACQAGMETPFGFGSSMSSRQANFHGDYPYGGASNGHYLRKTTEVGSYLPNAWGLFDMHGNVWEWCQDWYAEYPSGPVTNPIGPASGSFRVRRGGSWLDYARICRSANRYGYSPSNRYGSIGFRLALRSNEK